MLRINYVKAKYDSSSYVILSNKHAYDLHKRKNNLLKQFDIFDFTTISSNVDNDDAINFNNINSLFDNSNDEFNIYGTCILLKEEQFDLLKNLLNKENNNG